MVSGTSDGRTLELFVRSLAPEETGGADHAKRVRALASGSQVQAASIAVWGQEVGLSTTAIRTPTGKAILDRVAELRSWADARDVTMAPFFESRQATADVTGEPYTAIRLPVSCLAEYVDGELVHVAPHTDGTAVCTVDDRLGRLEDSGDELRGADAGATGHPITH